MTNNLKNIDVSCKITPAEQICMLCHLSSECDNCCRRCSEECNAGQACMLPDPEGQSERLDTWRYLVKEADHSFGLSMDRGEIITILQPQSEKKKIDIRCSYPGGKGGAGVYQNIINLIPPHETYIETHLGGGSILRRKKSARNNIGIDIDPEVIKVWQSGGTLSSNLMMKHCNFDDDPRDLNIINADASSFLKKYQSKRDEFIYCDPPYLIETRKGGKLYDYEYTTQDHIDLLGVLKTLPCMVMISGYWSSLYDQMLQGWNTHSFTAQTRQGPATEWVWFNYSIPKELHDYSYLGSTFRERERIKNRKNRWLSRLKRMPDLERNAFIEELTSYRRNT